MPLFEHNLAELMAQLNAAAVAEAPAKAVSSSAEAGAVAVVLVGTAIDGEHGLPLWHALGNEPWMLV